MEEPNDESPLGKAISFANGLPPSVRAAALFAVPFAAVDAFNYYSVGTALVVSLPLLAILYACCGALAARFASNRILASSDYLVSGAVAGLCLWLISTVFNALLSLVIGAATLGGTLLLGIPYLCLCAPVQLFGGAAIGALGAFIYGLFTGQSRTEDEDAI